MGSGRSAGEAALGGSHAGWRGDCGLGGLLCYDYGRDSPNTIDAAHNIFIALVVAWALAVAVAYAARKGGAKQWTVWWSGLALSMLCLTQYYFIFRAANVLPPSLNDVKVLRYDCLDSSKGGKISTIEGRNIPGIEINFCFCHQWATCYDEENGVAIEPANCPTDGSAKCRNPNGKGISMNMGQKEQTATRDCAYGRGSRCTKDEPCTPCQLSKLLTFPTPTYCGACTALNPGNCHFQPGVGPYCLKSPDSREIEPCTQCCTEKNPVFILFDTNTSSPNYPQYNCYLHQKLYDEEDDDDDDVDESHTHDDDDDRSHSHTHDDDD